MRLGIAVRPGFEAVDAAAAEHHGCFGVLVDAQPGAEGIAGSVAASRTSLVRIILRIHLGDAHPVSLAEEIAVLDNISAGRVVVLADTGDLTVEEAAEDVGLLVSALSARPVRHQGSRWRVPAGLEVHTAPESVQVTPEPVQVVVGVWLTGRAAVGVAEDLRGLGHLPVLATEPGSVIGTSPVQPGIVALPADIDAGRRVVQEWADAGTTHVILTAEDPQSALPMISRYLAPEVAMPHFPRVVAEAMTPAAWPRDPSHNAP